jgi:hypothetical protein
MQQEPRGELGVAYGPHIEAGNAARKQRYTANPTALQGAPTKPQGQLLDMGRRVPKHFRFRPSRVNPAPCPKVQTECKRASQQSTSPPTRRSTSTYREGGEIQKAHPLFQSQTTRFHAIVRHGPSTSEGVSARPHLDSSRSDRHHVIYEAMTIYGMLCEVQHVGSGRSIVNYSI